MARLDTLARRLQTAIRIIENPALFKLRQQGGLLPVFLALDQPWFHALNIATVLDIGANVGQFTLTIKTLLPKAQVYSFEPLPQCFEQLQIKMQAVEGFTAFNLALGEVVGQLPFEYNSFSASSSFLKMTAVHQREYPFTRDTQTVTVCIEPLDSATRRLTLIDPLLIKIDVQGYEDRVLGGGEQTIKRAKMIIVETSFERFYEGQPLFDDIYRKLTGWGFTYRGELDRICSSQDGRILQADGIFIRAL